MYNESKTRKKKSFSRYYIFFTQKKKQYVASLKQGNMSLNVWYELKSFYFILLLA